MYVPFQFPEPRKCLHFCAAVVPGAALYTSPVYQFAFLNKLIRLTSCYPLLTFEVYGLNNVFEFTKLLLSKSSFVARKSRSLARWSGTLGLTDANYGIQDR